MSDPVVNPVLGLNGAGRLADQLGRSPVGMLPSSIDDTQASLLALGYVPERSLATVVYLALKLQRPVLLEGEPGTGKTEIAKTLAAMLGRPLIRLQCHEGLDLAGAAYEWNYARQMMEIRLAEAGGQGGSGHAADRDALAAELFSARFLIKRALLQAIDPANPVAPVLLIDELDRADEPFEAFLLEVLSDFQITIPEFGTVKAKEPPIVVLTSNRTREIHDAVKRRCLYHWVDFPTVKRELQILEARLPQVGRELAREIVAFIQGLRKLDLYKLPGIAETLEWSRALLELDAMVLDPELVQQTLGVLLKYQDDIQRVHGSEAARLLEEARVAARSLQDAARA
ncbi:MoxR-like ATPase [Sphaerotilus mobilis]|uniref:MoxR-like ATPase n=2 Tax=Sphaerotilus mobilis TaxID=47994 RepID=A0A4Q7LRG1_9BURK|nr:MoxR-like ATPase [Sphaerotilus mobilis]